MALFKLTGGANMIRTSALILSCISTLAACNKVSAGNNSQIDFAKDANKALPRIARCSQVSEIEKITVRETLLVKIGDGSISGTYHFATGEKETLTDTGFQHLSGLIEGSQSKDAKVSVKLKNGSLNVFFDEDFAPEKDLTELIFDLKEKKITFLLGDESRETVVGGCTFE